MRYKEIVLVRVFGSNRELMVKEVSKMLLEMKALESQASIELYCSMTLPTDFSVHLDYIDSEKRNTPSAFGQRLAEALKEFGLIRHSVWLEEKM